MKDYLVGMDLSKRVLFDATGNMFCPRCWLCRIDGPVGNWLDGTQELGSVQLPDVDVVLQEHQTLCESVAAQGCTPCRCILPHDLQGLSDPGAFENMRRCIIPDRTTLVRRVESIPAAADSGRKDI